MKDCSEKVYKSIIRGRVYQLTQPNAKATLAVIKCMFSISNSFARALIDSVQLIHLFHFNLLSV